MTNLSRFERGHHAAPSVSYDEYEREINELKREVSDLREELAQAHDKPNRCLGCCTPAKGK